MKQVIFRKRTLAGAMLVASVLSGCGGGGDATPPATGTPAPADTTPPTVSISDNVSGVTATGAITFTFTFSESVGTSFTASDVVVTSGTAGQFTMVNSTTATLVVTPSANTTGTVQVSVAAGSFADAAGNVNTASASASQGFSTVVAPPVVPTTGLVTFDESTAPVMLGFGGAEDSTIQSDPVVSSNKVVRIVKSATAELWAGTTISRCTNNSIPALPFTASNQSLSVRFYSPDANIPVRLKVENAGDSTKSVETEAVATSVGWQTLQFNFANQATGTSAISLANTYNKVSIFPNFGKTGVQVGSAKTYYVDDISFVGASYTPACPVLATINFDESPAPTLTGFGGAENSTIAADPTNSGNKVVQVVKSATAELWAGTTMSNLTGQTVAPITFTASNKRVTARVYSPVANIPVRLKVENASNGAISSETQATVSQANTWQTLTFDFDAPAAGSSAPDLAQTYNKISVFFDFGTTGATVGSARTYYLDDLNYTPGTPPAVVTQTLPVTFDNSAVTYTVTGFEGLISGGLAADPTNAANQTVQMVKGPSSQPWAGATVSTGANLSIATVGFTASRQSMSLRVYAPAAGITIRLKMEDAADPTRSVETEAVTSAANTWQTLVFNFGNQAAGTAALNTSYTYNKVSVFPDFSVVAPPATVRTYYFDDLVFMP
jgi:Bacterial Ig-like domain